MTEQQPPSRRDPLVDRVNELTTTALDAVALVAICAGLGVTLQPVIGRGAALMCAGLLLAALSMLTQIMHRDRPPKPAPPPAPRDLPGPEDPGNVHVRGR